MFTYFKEVTWRDKALIYLISIFTAITLASAQGDPILFIGQNKTFINFNYHDTVFMDTPDDPQPWPPSREASYNGNTARVSLFATPGYGCNALSFIGVRWIWNLGPYTWDQVKDRSVIVTLDLDYNLNAHYMINTSADSWIELIERDTNAPGKPPFLKWIGYKQGNSGHLSGNMNKAYMTTFDKIGKMIALGAGGHAGAHEFAVEGETGRCLTELHLNSIKIEFPPKLYIENYHIDDQSKPVACLGSSVFIFCRVKDNQGNTVQADEITADIIKPDGSKEIITMIPYPPLNNYRGEYQTAPKVKNYDNMGGIYKAVIQAKKAGYIQGISGELNFVVKPSLLKGRVWKVVPGKGYTLIERAKNVEVIVKDARSGDFICSRMTDSQGIFMIESIKPGSYSVTAKLTIPHLSGNYFSYPSYSKNVEIPPCTVCTTSVCGVTWVEIPADMTMIEKLEQMRIAQRNVDSLRKSWFETAYFYHIGRTVVDVYLGVRTIAHALPRGEIVDEAINSVIEYIADLANIPDDPDDPLSVIPWAIDQAVERFQEEAKNEIDILHKIANDPPDANYSKVVALNISAPIHLPHDYNEPFNKSFVRMVNAQTNQSALEEALVESFERYQGALESGQSYYAKRQAQAIRNYSRLLNKNSAELKNATAQFRSEIIPLRVSLEENLTLVQQRLSSTGFTPEELQLMIANNFTDQDINATKDVILAINFTEMIGGLNDSEEVWQDRGQSALGMFNLSSKALSFLTQLKGCYVGAYLGTSPTDLSCESLIDFNHRAKKQHAMFSRLVGIDDSENLSNFDWADMVIRNDSVPLFIYDPQGGLDSINMTKVEHFAARCNNLSSPAFIVFGDQMNCPWVPWGNQPDKYKATFRQVAEVFHRLAPEAYMCWVPMQNYGYPWGGVDYGDGYSEYYPNGTGTYGDYVDWVGLTFFDNDFDEDNQIPPDLFRNGIRNGQDGIDFHRTFAEGKNKPMMIAGTGAFDPNKDPTDAGVRVPLSISEQAEYKNSWISQVYNVSLLKNELPMLNAICYLDSTTINHMETQNHNFGSIEVDYRIPDHPYRDLISDPYFLGAITPTILYPDFTDTVDPEGWRSLLFINNPTSFAANISLEIRSRSGTPLYLGNKTIPAKGISVIRPRDLVGSDCSGSVSITSDQLVTGICQIIRNSDSQGMSYRALNYGSTTLYYPDFTDSTDHNSWKSCLILQNPTVSAVDTSFEIRSKAGSVLYSGSQTIAPYGVSAVRPRDLAGVDCSGSVVVTSNHSLMGICQIVRNDESMHTVYNAFDTGSTQLYYPDFIDTNELNDLQSLIVLQNIGKAAANVTLVIRSRSGDLLYTGPQTLPSHGVITIRPHDLVGSDCSGLIVVASDQLITGTCQIIRNDDSRGMIYSALDMKSVKLQYPDFIDITDSNGWGSLFILQNPGTAAANITLDIRSRSGDLLYIGSKTIQANTTNIIRPRDLVGSDCSGSATISSDQPIIGICKITKNDNGMCMSYSAFE